VRQDNVPTCVSRAPLRPNPRERRAVLGPVKAWPGNTRAKPKATATASLDSSLRATRLCSRRPGRRNSHQARTKELPPFMRRLPMT
jgi:hypothetical protein